MRALLSKIPAQIRRITAPPVYQFEINQRVNYKIGLSIRDPKMIGLITDRRSTLGRIERINEYKVKWAADNGGYQDGWHVEHSLVVL